MLDTRRKTKMGRLYYRTVRRIPVIYACEATNTIHSLCNAPDYQSELTYDLIQVCRAEASTYELEKSLAQGSGTQTTINPN